MMLEQIVFLVVWVIITCLLLLLYNLIFKSAKRSAKSMAHVASEAEAKRILRKAQKPGHSAVRLMNSIFLLACLAGLPTFAQQKSDEANKPSLTDSAVKAKAPDEPVTPKIPEMTERERLLLERIEKLEKRLAEVEATALRSAAKENAATVPPTTVSAAKASETLVEPETATTGDTTAQTNQTAAQSSNGSDFLRNATINFTLDTYYGYNFNRPAGRVNLLRAYDVTSNSFSLHQATIIIEQAPNVDEGRRFGARVDLMYGQATETLQGNAANELRPQAYRPVFQAYGTYVAPLGNGLTVDFGKWASSLGIESNYTKDQMNYSRSYFFNFLPFYHFGFRSNYAFNDKFNATYWLVNGTQQSEDYNGFKSQALLLNSKPSSRVSWNVNYYTGIESRDTVPNLNPGFATLPTQPGLPTEILRSFPHGRLHIFDTYATWNATDKLTLAGEADYVVSRVETISAPSQVVGGAAYARYQFTPKFALAARGEYFSDRGGLFSGLTQALKETTLTADFKLADGFLVRGEWRRDFSNQRFFVSDVLGVLKNQQTTATLGLIWWFGNKQGSW